MWRGVEAYGGGEALGRDATLCGQILGQNGGDEGRSGAFALGAGNVDGIEGVEVGRLHNRYSQTCPG